MLLNVQKFSWFTAASKPLLVALCRHTVLCDRLADQLSKLAPADKGFARVLRECAGPVLYGPSNLGGLTMFTAIQVVAPSLRVELSSAAVRNAGEIERAVAAQHMRDSRSAIFSDRQWIDKDAINTGA
jgi:hypothetical protein